MRTNLYGIEIIYLDRYIITTKKTGGTTVHDKKIDWTVKRKNKIDALEWVMEHVVDDMQSPTLSHSTCKKYAQDLKNVMWHIDHERLKTPPQELE